MSKIIVQTSKMLYLNLFVVLATLSPCVLINISSTNEQYSANIGPRSQSFEGTFWLHNCDNKRGCTLGECNEGDNIRT